MPTRRRLFAQAMLVAASIAGPLASVAARADTSSSAPVDALDDAIVAAMHAGRTASFAQRMDMLTPVVQASFDLPRILRNTVGLRFAGFPPAVQAELLDVFTQFTVASYIANFDDYNGERFDTLPDIRRAGTDEVVQTRVTLSTGEVVKIDYVMHHETGWKIVDVLLNGSISRVAVQRSDFRSLLEGGDAAKLIVSLRAKITRLAAGQTD